MKIIKEYNSFVNEMFVEKPDDLEISEDSENNEEIPDDYEHIEGLNIEITKKECDENGNKDCDGYDVVYSKTIDDVTYIIYGSLIPYNTGRMTDYKFEPDDFEDQESEDYYDNNHEEIEEEIIDKYYEL